MHCSKETAPAPLKHSSSASTMFFVVRSFLNAVVPFKGSTDSIVLDLNIDWHNLTSTFSIRNILCDYDFLF